MNYLMQFVKTLYAKALLLLIAASLVFHSSCSGSRITRISNPPDKFIYTESTTEYPFLKLHMYNGELYILENWKFNPERDSISGFGTHYNINRGMLSNNNYTIPTEKVVLAETNQIGGSAGAGALTALTIVTGVFTVVCLINPKACFGSCPTFYANNGEEYIVQSEGFSSSISPALEERDVDALYRIKPQSDNFEIQLRNEAYETHVIRSANLLAVPKPEGGRVLSTPAGEFFEAKKITEASEVVASEGDISEKLCSFDGNERFSAADSNDLASKEIIEVKFNKPSSDSIGIVIAARQTLLTTFLFYQTLSYMGSTAGHWLASIERNSNQFKSLLDNARSALGNIEVLQQNENGEWEKVGEVGETGPIATDIKLVPLLKIIRSGSGDSPTKIRLKMSKGLWRIDYLAIADLGNKVKPIVIPPSTSVPQLKNSTDVIEALTNPDSVLITLPGDNFFLNYKLPLDYNNYELFMDTQGYYLEWMRNEWLAEENPKKVYQMLLNPRQFYKDLAPQFKKVEAEMEQTFWSSKYVIP